MATKRKSRTRTTVAHFSIQGEFLTDFVRTIVQEGKWDRALKILMESVIGMTYDVAIQILKGEKMLSGWDSEITLTDDTTDLEPYKRQLDFLYGSYYRKGDKYFIPYKSVVSFVEEDYQFAKERWGHLERKEMLEKRALYYAENSNDILFIVHHPKFGKTSVLFRETNTHPPIWYSDTDIAQTPDEAFKNAINRFRIDVCDPIEDGRREYTEEDAQEDEIHEAMATAREKAAENYIKAFGSMDPFAHIREEMEEIDPDLMKRLDKQREEMPNNLLERYEDDLTEEEYEAQLLEERERIKEQVLAQNGDRWLYMNVDENIAYKIPELPFLYWCAHGREALYDKLPPYTPVSTSGYKMAGDDPYHTDWMIGAGLDPRTMYRDDELMSLSWKLQSQKQKEYFNYEVNVLAGSGKAHGVVRKHTSKNLEAGDIVIIPNAGPEYQIQAMTVCKKNAFGQRGAVIAEVGGPMAHLVKVSRELDLRLIRVDDAMKKIPIGATVDIDFDKGTLTITP